MRFINLNYAIAFCIKITKKIELRIGYFHWPWVQKPLGIKWYDFSIKKTFQWFIRFTTIDRKKDRMIQFRVMFLSMAVSIKKD